MHIYYQLTSSSLTRISAILLLIIFLGQACSGSKEAAPIPSANTSNTKKIEQESVLTQIDSISVDSTKPKSPHTSSEIARSPDVTFVDSLLASMSLREKIGQLFIIRAKGYFQNDDDKSYGHLIDQIKNYDIGGIIFFKGNIYGQTVLTNQLQEKSNIPLWITQDMEFGAAMRVNGATRLVPAMGVAATQDPKYAYWMGKITASEAKALGVNQIFAPVLDVNNNPRNPVINVRSFSGNPDTVARYGNAFIRGVKSEGVISTGKHFPGHGDTGTDSHIALPVIKADYARLDSVELVPFRSAIDHGIPSIMSAHISFPNIGSEPNLPATLDPAILHGILRDSLNFDGLVVTDGLEMRGIASHFSPGEVVIRALKAGSDLMLLSPDDLTAINEIEVAVQKGRLPESRIDQSVRKLLTYKIKQGLFKHKKIDIATLGSTVHTIKNQLIADEISRKSLTLLKNGNNILPIRSSKYPRVMVVTVADDKSGDTGSSFASQMRQYHPYVISHVLDRRSSDKEKKEILKDARQADLIIIGSFIYVRSGQKVQFRSEHRRLLQNLIRNKPSVLVAFGNPYVVQDLPETDVQLMAWAANDGQIKSVAPALFGGSDINGKLPIKIPGMYSIGDGLTLGQSTLRYDAPEVAGLSRDSLLNIDHIMNKAIFDSTFPGGAVAVVKDGLIAYQKGFGYETYKKLKPVKSTDIYDLASLTKVVATTPSVMKLIDEGKLSLDDKVSKYIPEFSEGRKAQITIRNLLLHNSGLPAFRIYIDKLKTKTQIIQAIKDEPLIYEPSTKYKYSDLGFILLGKIVEQISGQSLDTFVRRNFYYPMGMNDTFFNPKKVGNWISRRIPPSEIDTTYRMKTMRADVNDERAYYMGGVAGHAGLFSSADDIARFCQMLINNGSYAGTQYLEPATVKIFTKRQSERSNRGYGFDRKSPEGFSTAGSLSSKETFGHLGFTGTSFWIDPQKEMAIIILTNRTYPHRSYGKNIGHIRSNVADAAISSIIE